MSIQIHELRLSYGWVKRFGQDAFLPYLASSDRYKHEFELAKNGTGEWLLPWRAGERQRFWQYYLGTPVTGDLASVDAQRAWLRLMPLRAPSLARIATRDGTRITLEGYVFPHSVGVLASVFICCEPLVAFDDMINRATATARTHYNISWKGQDGGETHGTLASLADLLIDQLHYKLFGESPHGNPLKGPITTATVIDGALDEPSPDPDADGAMVDRGLDRLCRLDTDGPVEPKAAAKGRPLPAAQMRRITIERGRAIWTPAKFSSSTRTEPRFRSLGCYHRNISLAALQAKSLTSLLRRAEDFLPTQPIPARLLRPVKSAIALLDELDKGEITTYQTDLLFDQIDHYHELMRKVGAAAGV